MVITGIAGGRRHFCRGQSNQYFSRPQLLFQLSCKLGDTFISIVSQTGTCTFILVGPQKVSSRLQTRWSLFNYEDKSALLRESGVQRVIQADSITTNCRQTNSRKENASHVQLVGKFSQIWAKLSCFTVLWRTSL